MKGRTTIKTLLLALSIGAINEQVSAQWSPIAKLGVGATDGCFSFSINGNGYVGGGSNGSHFYEYDTTANTWTLKGNAPGNKIRGFAFSFVLNGHGYAGTGDTTGSDNACADMWMYDPGTNVWTKKASFPGGVRDAGFGFAIDSFGYAGAGYDGSGAWNDFYKYDPIADTWTPLAALPFGPILFPVTFVLNHKAYVATGQGATAEVQSLWEYDPATNTWTQKADFPGAARQTGFGFALGNYGYVGGGMAGYDTMYKDMWRYDPTANSWTMDQAYPSLYPAWPCSFTVGNTAYVGTGTYFTATSLISTDSFKRFRGPRITTGINETNAAGQIKAYPNPANDYIVLAGNVEADAKIAIKDVTGRSIRTLSNTHNSIYVGDLQPGVYMLECINSTGIFVEKIIKR